MFCIANNANNTAEILGYEHIQNICLAVVCSTSLVNLGHFGLLHNAVFGHVLQQLCSTNISAPRAENYLKSGY